MPDQDRPLIGLGRISLLQGRLDQAREFFLRALEVNAQADEALRGLGEVSAAAAAGNWQEALAKFQQALEVNPQNRDALLGLAEAAEHLRQLPRAISFLKRYLELHLTDFEVLFRLASAFEQEGKYPEALGALERILLFNPENREAAALRETINKRSDNNH
jgi:tetratricopeptide (TPR) repeat protein